MQLYRLILGVEISENYVRAAEVEHRDGEFFLSRVAQRELVSHEAGDLGHALDNLIEEESLLSKTASFAIDTALTQQDTIDVDPDLDDNEVVNFVKAELALHTGTAVSEYKPAYQIIGTSANGYPEVFYAAVKKGLLESLRIASMNCGLDLRFVDVDHSCSEIVATTLFQLKNFVLVSVKENQVEASFCRNGARAAYRSSRYVDDPAYSVVRLVQDVESVVKESAPKVLICGRAASKNLVELFRTSVDERYEPLQPAQHLLLSHFVAANEELRTDLSLYSAAIGAALK